jgi:FdrA protein
MDGFGLGFANAVRAGPVGIGAAVRTGAQQVTTLLDLAGRRRQRGARRRRTGHVRPGRCRATRIALKRLAADAATEHIVVVSKPPSPAVEAEIRALDLAKRSPSSCSVPARRSHRRHRGVPGRVGVKVPSWPIWGWPAPAP